MLNVYFGNMPEAVFNTSVYFKNAYQDSWLTDDFAKNVIKSVDKSDVISANMIQSPVLGQISPMQLSGGVKALLLMKHVKDEVFNASNCGDNCAEWILKLAEDRKLVINLRHLMDFGKGEFKIKVLNNGKIAHNMKELVLLAGIYV